MGDFIPVNVPVLNGNERKYLNECIDTGWISSEGPFIKRFEEAFAARVSRAHGVSVSSGTAALDVAVAALDIGVGDEVILPTLTIISCAAAVVRSGATPVLVDSDPHTWNMIPSHVEAKITPNTRAIMVVHLYGLPVDMDPILEIAARHKLAIIEDTAEVIGQTYRGKNCGSFGDISTFSFYPNKHVTTGEGGMLCTDDANLAERCRSFRDMCFLKSQRFFHEDLGWNFRFSNVHAALGLAQLERLDETVTTKRRMGRRYTELLRDVPGIELPIPGTAYAENIYWVFGIVIKDEVPFDAKEAMARLAKLGVGTRPFFWPMHEQPVFHGMDLFPGESYPSAERLARRGFYIPSGVALTDDEMVRVAAALKEVFA